MRYTLPTLALASLLCMPGGISLAQQTDDGSTATTNANPNMQGMHRMRGPMTTEEQLAHMTRALNLTSDQQTQIKPLLDARRQQMMAIHQDQSLSREDRMGKMKTLDDDTHSKIAAVLNDEQKAKFEKMAERREHNMDHGMAPNSAPQQ
jgi:Spy/CpxP family protein refolding chaperone